MTCLTTGCGGALIPPPGAEADEAGSPPTPMAAWRRKRRWIDPCDPWATTPHHGRSAGLPFDETFILRLPFNSVSPS